MYMSTLLNFFAQVGGPFHPQTRGFKEKQGSQPARGQSQTCWFKLNKALKSYKHTATKQKYQSVYLTSISTNIFLTSTIPWSLNYIHVKRRGRERLKNYNQFHEEYNSCGDLIRGPGATLAIACIRAYHENTIWRELHNQQYTARTTHTATPKALPERIKPPSNKTTMLYTTYKANNPFAQQ